MRRLLPSLLDAARFVSGLIGSLGTMAAVHCAGFAEELRAKDAPALAMPDEPEPAPVVHQLTPFRPADVAALSGTDALLLEPETCRRCRFYEASNGQAGECRLAPPFFIDDGAVGGWPIVRADQHCGAFYAALVPLPN